MAVIGQRIALIAVVLALGPLVVHGEDSSGHQQENVRFSLKVSAEDTVEGSLHLRNLSGDGDGDGENILDITTTRVLALPVGTSWEVKAEIPGYWVQPQVVNVRSGPVNQFVLRAWRLGRLIGRLDLAPEGGPPKGDLVVRSERPPLAQRGPDTPPAGKFPCQVSPETSGRFECDVPLGRLDLGLYLDDHAPVYRWGFEVRPDGPADLGTVRFVRGGSLSGWTLLEGEDLEADRGRVELRPALAPGPQTPVTERLAEAVVETTIDPRGFFQLTGLAPGSYDLTVTYPGFARFDLANVEIPSPAETRLNGVIELQRPLQLEFQLVPPLDWRDQPWTLEIRRTDTSGRNQAEPLFQGTVDRSGRALVPDQTPGPLSIEIYDSLGNRFHYEPELWIQGDDDTRSAIFLETVAVEGRLAYGSTPLAGTVWFGGRQGSPRVEVETDETGRFAAALPEAGRWPIEVEASLPETHDAAGFGPDENLTATLSVLIEKDDFLDLEIPETLVFGWVTDAAGQPAVDASVRAYAESLAHRTRTGSDGSFALRGLPAGDMFLTARQGSQREGVSASATRTIKLVEGEPLGPIELSLEGKNSFGLQVVSDRGPVPGATLYLYGHVPASAYVGVGRSDAEGRARIDVPESAQLVRAIIFAPGHGLRAELLDVTRDEAVVQVDRWSGTLDADLGRTWEELYDEQQTVVIFQDGQPIPLGRLLEWGRALGVSTRQDRGFSVPGLAPGAYRVCMGPAIAVAPDRLDAWLEGLPCAEGQLSGGGTLSLELRVPR